MTLVEMILNPMNGLSQIKIALVNSVQFLQLLPSIDFGHLGYPETVLHEYLWD